MNYYIKILTGYNTSISIPADEAHKAYYLFLNPEKRTIFSNGTALIGKNIMGIEPDYIKTMGWNEGYKLTADDFSEIRDKQVDVKMKLIQEKAKSVAHLANNDIMMLAKPLSEIIEEKKAIGNDYYSNFRLN